MNFITVKIICLKESSQSGMLIWKKYQVRIRLEDFVLSFQIFFLVVLFGMFYGTVFLPVLLSLIGPEPYELPRTIQPQSEPMKVYRVCNTEPS
jgi:predicted CDP-diglyceride synthetase/phosphatidate cytidylyltransferase